MRITLNGQPRELPGQPTLADLLAEAGYADRRVAVEVNAAVVPKGRHAMHGLAEGDVVEIIVAMGGG
jgi:sulfur carrier protein